MAGITRLIRRAEQAYRIEGLGSLLRRAFAYCIFQYRTYVLFYTDMDENLRRLNQAQPMLRIAGFASRTICTNGEADELEAQGFEFRSKVVNAGEVLDSSAAAVCVFVGGELAGVGWVAFTQKAMDALSNPPYSVDFGSGETCTGNWSINPKHRGVRLAPYISFLVINFLHEKGVKVDRTVVGTKNTASLRATEKAGYIAWGIGRHLRILWWESWKERPLALESAER